MMLSVEDACEVLYAAGLPCCIENVTMLREDSVDAPDTDPMLFVDRNVDENPDRFVDWPDYLSQVTAHLGYSVPEEATENFFEQLQFKMADHGMLTEIVDERSMIRVIEEALDDMRS